MHIDTPLKQRTDAPQRKTRVHLDAYCPLSDNPSAMPDDGRAPVWSHVISRLLAAYCNETKDEPYLKAPAKRIAAADMPSPWPACRQRHSRSESTRQRLSFLSLQRNVGPGPPANAARPMFSLLPVLEAAHIGDE